MAFAVRIQKMRDDVLCNDETLALKVYYGATFAHMAHVIFHAGDAIPSIHPVIGKTPTDKDRRHIIREAQRWRESRATLTDRQREVLTGFRTIRPEHVGDGWRWYLGERDVSGTVSALTKKALVRVVESRGTAGLELTD